MKITVLYLEVFGPVPSRIKITCLNIKKNIAAGENRNILQSHAIMLISKLQ
jgi:hypothetical protein